MRFVEHAFLPGAVFDKVVGPDIIALFRPQRMHEPSASQSLPRLRCSWGTFSPSRCPDSVDESGPPRSAPAIASVACIWPRQRPGPLGMHGDAA